jgi:type I restriction enzyme S subunit
MRMNETKENKLVPKLRFPEFLNDGEWEEKSLENVALFLKGKGISKSEIVSNGKTPCIRYGELYTHYNEIIDKIFSYTNLPEEDLILSEANDVIIPSSGETQEDIATASCVVRKGIALGGDINILRSKVNGIFLSYYLTHIKKKAITKIAQGNAVVHLYSSQLKKLQINIPQNTDEQQKIADCLSSLDEVITSESLKVKVLKENKKGLLQNLFPQAGETVPKLRFKEFEESGDWGQVALEKITHKIMVGIASAATHAYRKSGVILFRNQNIKEGYLDDNDILFIEEEYEKAHKNKRLKAGDLLTARTGYPGTTCAVPEKYEGSQSFTTLITRPNNKLIDSTFLCFYINSEPGQAFFESTKIGGGQKNVNAGSLTEMPITFPKDKIEQQKIASCLSSIDDLINAQSQKVETLKLHKKGLLQGLFPIVNEVNI